MYLWGETVETSGLFALISFLVQLDGCGRGIWTTYNRGGNRNFIEITGVLLTFLALKNTVFRWPKIKVGTKVGTNGHQYRSSSDIIKFFDWVGRIQPKADKFAIALIISSFLPFQCGFQSKT